MNRWSWRIFIILFHAYTLKETLPCTDWHWHESSPFAKSVYRIEDGNWILRYKRERERKTIRQQCDADDSVKRQTFESGSVMGQIQQTNPPPQQTRIDEVCSSGRSAGNTDSLYAVLGFYFFTLSPPAQNRIAVLDNITFIIKFLSDNKHIIFIAYF